MGLNELLDMMDSVNPNDVSLHSAYFAFMMNPNRDNNYRYIGIVSNMLEYQPKASSPSIRSVPLFTSTTTSHVNLEENNGW